MQFRLSIVCVLLACICSFAWGHLKLWCLKNPIIGVGMLYLKTNFLYHFSTNGVGATLLIDNLLGA